LEGELRDLGVGLHSPNGGDEAIDVDAVAAGRSGHLFLLPVIRRCVK
jgi:hypothetical protein